MNNNNESTETTTYHAFTIGPLFRTITRVRKTRELWAASYMFSFLMRSILESFTPSEIILPYAGDSNQMRVDLPLSPHGAGIYPDRCILRLADPSVATTKINQAVKNALEKLENQLIPKGTILATEFKQLNVSLKDLILIYPIEWSGDASGKNFVHEINAYLDNLELSSHYQPVESVQLTELLQLSIHQFYQAAEHKDSSVFIKMRDGTRRLLSLPEIALRELRFDENLNNTSGDNLVKSKMEGPISEDVITMKKAGAKAKKIDSLQKEETLYKDLKTTISDHINIQRKTNPDLNLSSLDFRHKYVAVVVADGDQVGKKITEICQTKEAKKNLPLFSKNLISYTKSAIQKVVDYGGLPIYGGGDDLLFIAPITNRHAPESHHIFALCDQLNSEFKNTIKGDTSLSFGVSISYYKYPLGEAVANAYKLEKRAKTKSKICFKADQPHSTSDKHEIRYEKQAICWEVRKHSGQQFGSTLWMGEPRAQNPELPSSRSLWLELLQPGSKLEQSFLTSVMHKLQGLPALLAHAAKSDNKLTNPDSFRKNHFNEIDNHEGDFIKSVFKLATAIFRDYGDHLDKEVEKDLLKESRFKDSPLAPLDLHHTNLLFSILRLKQFMTQPDHD